MVFLVGVGLGGLCPSFPVRHAVMKGAGTAYRLWLAWTIGRANPNSAPVFRFCMMAHLP